MTSSITWKASSCTPSRPSAKVSVREAILNAVSHRDYRHPGSVFVRQYPRRLEIVSPGGFPTGITPDNIIDKQFPRNRRIAETFLRCGLVERAGQGANRMLVEAVRDSKPLPDYSRSDEHEVFLSLARGCPGCELRQVPGPRGIKSGATAFVARISGPGRGSSQQSGPGSQSGRV